jgi:hypothetical protein
MRTAVMLCALAGAALVLAACNSAEPASSGGLPITTPTSAVDAADPAPQAEPEAKPPAAAAQWAMPNLVGSNLQAAQDRIQAVTGNPIFITFSHDATGQGRNQVLDSNWKVCSQNIAPGAAFTDTTRIDFGAVKLAERCR